MTDKKELRLIAFDLDGTFLNDSKEIPEENLHALEKAAERGIAVVPATGRLYPALPHELRELPFMRYYILINGAKVYDAREDKVLFSAELPNELALALFSHAEEIGCLYDCYLRDKGLMSRGLYDALDEIVESLWRISRNSSGRTADRCRRSSISLKIWRRESASWLPWRIAFRAPR